MKKSITLLKSKLCVAPEPETYHWDASKIGDINGKSGGRLKYSKDFDEKYGI